jgi:hypothetical protein
VSIAVAKVLFTAGISEEGTGPSRFRRHTATYFREVGPLKARIRRLRPVA